MPVLTLTQQLLNPSPDAAYAVHEIAIPATDVGVPQARIDQFAIPPEQADGLHKRAAEAQQPGTFFVPRNWSGSAVLVIPGSGDNRHAFKWLIFRKLLDHNLAILTVDPPGHGQFTQVPCTLANIQHAARNWSRWLHAQPGVTCVGVLGISFGGCQAADSMAHDERIVALATIATPVHLPLVTHRVFVRESLALLLPRNALLLRYQSLRKMWAEWRSMGNVWFGEGLYDMIERFDMLNTVRQIGTRPTLFMHGKRDFGVPPNNAQQLYDAAIPERELIWSSQATHVSVVLQDKEISKMADWMAAKLSARNGQNEQNRQNEYP